MTRYKGRPTKKQLALWLGFLAIAFLFGILVFGRGSLALRIQSSRNSVRVDASLAVQLLQDYLGLSLDRYAVDDVGPLLPPIRCQCYMNNVIVSSICAKDPLTDWVGCLDVPFVHVFIAPSGTVRGKFGTAQLK